VSNEKYLVIAEKPMLAKAILEAIPGQANTVKYGARGVYYVKGCYTVVALAGHVMELKQPEDYDPALKKWSLSSLPIFFNDWEIKPSESKKETVNCVGKLLKNADTVIHAGDVDDEGQLIVDEVLSYFQYKGKVLRLYTSDTSKQALEKRLRALEDNGKWKSLGESADARRIADFAFGVNYTRYYSLINNSGVLSVGRVQTPTMGLVVNRDAQIASHQVRKYYTLKMKLAVQNGEVDTEYQPYDSSGLLGEDGKVWQPDGLVAVKDRCMPMPFTCKVSHKDEKEAAPLPFNLNKLNLYCSSRWGYDPTKVMEITQSLRENYRAITYNRSDSQYLTEEQFSEAPGVISRVLKNLGMQIDKIDTKQKSKCFDNSKVTAHTAIIPTCEDVDVSKMSQPELNVYKAICGYYLIQFLPPCLKRRTIMKAECEDKVFTANSTQVFDKSFKAYIKAGDDDKAPEFLSTLADGIYQASAVSGEVLEHETTPPKRYTKATLASDMSNVAKYVTDMEIRQILIRKDAGKEGENGSIGTGATRPAIIDGLIKRGFLKEDGKYIVSTKLGQEFFASLSPAIKNADVTAKWWLIQEGIKDGTSTSNDLFTAVMSEFDKARAENGTKQTISSSPSRSTERPSFGACPRCGKPIIEGAKGFGCSGYKDGCKFTVWKTGEYGIYKVLNDSGKKMTAAMVSSLLKNGKVLVNGLKSSKSDKKYDAFIVMKDDGERVSFELSFDDLPKKKYSNKKGEKRS